MTNVRDSRRGSSPGLLLPAMTVAAISALTTTGCGDGPICQAEVLVIIQSPSGTVLADSNLVEDGVQTDVRVRTTLGSGVDVVLTVLGEDDAALGTVTVATDEDGDVTFEDVTLPAGAVALRAFADGGDCGSDEDVVTLDIAAGRDCALTILQTPIDVDFYAPLGVLNLSNDDNIAMPNFQAEIDVSTQPGFEVELFVIGGDTGVETSAGTEAADGDGVTRFAISLAQGRQSIRAVCSATTGLVSSPSLTTSVFVDTEAPGCTLTAPAEGATITPAFDGNGDLGDGVQLTLEAQVDGADVEDEATTFVVTVDGTDANLDGSPIDGAGYSRVAATVAPATAPSTAQVMFSTLDHAENACVVTETYDVVYEGCDITVEAPTGTVSSDADGDGGNGAQVDVDLQVSAACVGQTVTSDCGLDNPSGVVAGDGSVTLRVSMCDTAPCDVVDACTFTVSTASGIETSAGASIHFDDQAPQVTVQLSQPALACGAQVTPSVDLDAGTPGVQIRVRVGSPLATTRQLEQTDASGTSTVDASAPGGEVVVTIEDGATSFVGIASDGIGNVARSASCAITMSEIVVSFVPPVDDGAVGSEDGVVAADTLTFDLCGRVSSAGATVAVTVDGGAPLAAVVTGTGWCVPLTLAASPPSYTIVATATLGMLVGDATLILSVDLDLPDPITDLGVVADTRQSLEASWTAPSDGGAAVSGYVVKVATVALTEDNFDSTGEEVFTGAPQAPGAAETLRIEPRRTGTQYWLGVAPVDAGGNRAAAAIVGPVTPRFDQTAAILPPETGGNALFGLKVARGKFNDDELWDVAIGAPGVNVGALNGAGAVYVYFGSADGIGDSPDVVIDGTNAGAAFGLSLTAVRWSSASRDDLVIGEPYSNNVNGRVYVFHGGADFTAGGYLATEADLQIGVNAVANYFTGGGLGWSLAAINFDGDAQPDLAIGVAAGGGGNGGVVVIYGGSVSGSQVLLSDADVSQLGGAVVQLINDPDPALFDIFGSHIFNVGRTQGGTDATDDLLISYANGKNRVHVYRGRTTRPTTTGVHARAFVAGTDVRIDHVTADTTTELGTSAASIADLNGDGARELVIGAYREGNNDGRVLIVDGNTVGTAGVASTGTADVLVTTITPEAGVTFLGASIVNNVINPGGDIDGDGFDDLIVSARLGGIAELLVWFGGSIPTGTVTTATAGHVIAGPSTFNGGVPGTGGTPHATIWAGDVNGDGLDDICWGDGLGNGSDGSFQVLWDDRN